MPQQSPQAAGAATAPARRTEQGRAGRRDDERRAGHRGPGVDQFSFQGLLAKTASSVHSTRRGMSSPAMIVAAMSSA